jgi:hypothetical protein
MDHNGLRVKERPCSSLTGFDFALPYILPYYIHQMHDVMIAPEDLQLPMLHWQRLLSLLAAHGLAHEILSWPLYFKKKRFNYFPAATWL